jgi:hypothetical protein
MTHDFTALYGAAKVAALAATADFIKSMEARYPGSHYDHHDACGFAWVEVPDGRSPFAKWAKKHGGAKKHWTKGVYFWNPGEYAGQSISGDEAGAVAFAKVLKEAGIDAHAASRLD